MQQRAVLQHLFNCVLIFLLIIFAASAKADPDVNIKVGVITGPPIAYQAEGSSQWRGVAPELWQQVAKENNWNYVLVPMGENVRSAIAALNQKKVDVLIGPISVTHDRLRLVDFSRPFMVNKVVALEESNEVNQFGSLLYMIISKVFNGIFLAVFLVFLLIANLLWYFERHHVRDFQKGYARGIVHAVWSLLMLLIGSQLVDKPRHRIGRFLVLLIIFLAIIFSSLISAAFTSSLTLSLAPMAEMRQLSVKDIQTKTFASVFGQQPGIMLQELGGNVVYFNDVNEAINSLLNNSKINAIVGDQVLLTYAMSRVPKLEKLKLTPAHLLTNEYAFAFPKDSPLLNQFDFALTKLQDQGSIMPICLKYLSLTDAGSCQI